MARTGEMSTEDDGGVKDEPEQQPHRRAHQWSCWPDGGTLKQDMITDASAQLHLPTMQRGQEMFKTTKSYDSRETDNRL